MKYCPKCGSSFVIKDKPRGRWTGDYICEDCGYNNDPKEFITDSELKNRLGKVTEAE